MQNQVSRSIFSKLFVGFGWFFKWGLTSIFLSILILNAIIISIENRSISYGIIDLGEKFATPTYNLQTESLKVIEQGGVYVSTDNFWSGIFDAASTYFTLIINLWIIWLWLKVLTKFFIYAILGDTSRVTPAILSALVFFVLIQMLLVALLKDGSIVDPLVAFWDFIRAFPYLIKSAAKIGEVAI